LKTSKGKIASTTYLEWVSFRNDFFNFDKTPVEFRDLREYQQTVEINQMLKFHRRTDFCNLGLGRFVQFRFLNVDASKFCNLFLVIMIQQFKMKMLTKFNMAALLHQTING
jgi:hypothetical protein